MYVRVVTLPVLAAVYFLMGSSLSLQLYKLELGLSHPREVHYQSILQRCLHMLSVTLSVSLLKEKANRHTAGDGRCDGGCLALSDCKARQGGKKEPKILPATLTNK